MLNELIKNEVFLGLLGTIIGGLLTYLGIRNKNKSDVTSIYTQEVRNIITDLKEQNDKKDNEITRMEVLVESLKEQLEQALELVDKLQNERELVKLDIEKKDKQIETLTKLVEALRKR